MNTNGLKNRMVLRNISALALPVFAAAFLFMPSRWMNPGHVNPEKRINQFSWNVIAMVPAVLDWR
jgi:hypothetical protein